MDRARLLRAGAQSAPCGPSHHHPAWRAFSTDVRGGLRIARHWTFHGRGNTGLCLRAATSDSRRQRQTRARALPWGQRLARHPRGRTAALGAGRDSCAQGTRRRIHTGNHGSWRYGLPADAAHLRIMPAQQQLCCLQTGKPQRLSGRCTAPGAAGQTGPNDSATRSTRPGTTAATSTGRHLGRIVGISGVRSGKGCPQLVPDHIRIGNRTRHTMAAAATPLHPFSTRHHTNSRTPHAVKYKGHGEHEDSLV